MPHLFLFILLILCVLRMPLALIPIVFQGLHPFFKKRLAFERKNFGADSSESFSLQKLSAHVCFEVSSEGELEQVRPLIEETLKRGERLEILFSSPSVEQKIERLYSDYPTQIRFLRLPILSFWPFSFLYFQNFWFWVTAPTVLFCRYDFFPELLLLKLFKKRFVLLSAATKKMNLYKYCSFKLFDLVVAATDKEAVEFQNFLKASIIQCDLRVPRIADRTKLAEQTLSQVSEENFGQYLDYLKHLPEQSSLIIGSCWPSDLMIFANQQFQDKIKSGQLHVCIAPHKIDPDSLAVITQQLQKLFSESMIGVLSKSNDRFCPVMIVDKSGILCELYTYFRIAYVGGGYERSIHSVLEPFLSGAKVVTGPKIYRSTEFDLIAETAPHEIHVLKNPESFYNQFILMLETGNDEHLRKDLIDHMQRSKQAVLNALK